MARTGGSSGKKARTSDERARTNGSDDTRVMGIRLPIKGKDLLFAVRDH